MIVLYINLAQFPVYYGKFLMLLSVVTALHFGSNQSLTNWSNYVNCMAKSLPQWNRVLLEKR
jgi:hypothetical protein